MSSHQTETLEGLNEVVDAVQQRLLGTDPDTKEFSDIVDQLDKLYKIKSLMKDDNRVSKDALVAVAGNLLGIVAILNFERVHIVTTKALGFVMKSRV